MAGTTELGSRRSGHESGNGGGWKDPDYWSDPPLSKREAQVLRLLAEGKNNAEIARELFISRQTVKKHVSSIFTKVDADNRVQAAVYAVRKGIV
jgi:DNA-binding NarL/FixJ family response regulator